MLQKLNTVLRSELLIKKLEEEANSYKRTFRGNQHEILDTASSEAKVAKVQHKKVVSGSKEPHTKVSPIYIWK